MDWKELLSNHKKDIFNHWYDLVVATYPEETAKFLKSKQDQFANPVGSTFRSSMMGILTGLENGKAPEELVGFIDDMMHIRAVQDFMPSRAVAVFLLLKEAIGHLIDKKHIDAPGALMELSNLVDRLQLIAFDTYMKCREKVWEIKYNEFMRRPFFAEVGMCPSYLLKKGILGRQVDKNNIS